MHQLLIVFLLVAYSVPSAGMYSTCETFKFSVLLLTN